MIFDTPRYIGIAGRASTGKTTLADLLCTRHGGVAIALADPLKQRALSLFEMTPDAVFGPSEARTRPFDLATIRDVEWWARVWRRWNTAGLWADLFDRAPEPIAAERIQRVAERAFAYLCAAEILTPRLILQTLGTEFGRELWPDVWFAAWRRTAEEIFSGVQYDPVRGLQLQSRDTVAAYSTPFVVCSDVRFPNEAEMLRALGGRVFWLDADRRIGPRIDGHASEPDRTMLPGWVTDLQSDTSPEATLADAELFLGLAPRPLT